MPWRYPRQLGTLSWTQQEYYFHGGNFSFVWGLSCVLGSLVASEHSTYPLLATWAYNGLPLPSGVAHEHMSCVATLHFATSHTSEERYSKAHWRTGNNCREDWTHSPTSSHTGVFVTRLFPETLSPNNTSLDQVKTLQIYSRMTTQRTTCVTKNMYNLDMSLAVGKQKGL